MKIKNILCSLPGRAGILPALITALLALALPARAQVTPLTSGQFSTTNVLAGLADNVTYIHGAGTTANTNVIRIHKDIGIGLLASFSPAAVTNVATIRYQVSMDGTNWAHATPHIMAFNLTAVSTNYIFATNLPPDVINNFQFVRLYSTITANTNAVTNAIYWSRRNQ